MKNIHFNQYIQDTISNKDGLTPADKVGIKIEGENKWLTLIQNASLKII